MPDMRIAEPVASGEHPNGAEGPGCGQECLRRELGLSWSDDPIDGQCLVLHRLVIEASDDQRTTSAERAPDGALWAAIVRTLGTDKRDATRARSWRCADWAVREVAPVALDALDLGDHADVLRGLAPIADETTATAAATAAAAAADVATGVATASSAAAYNAAAVDNAVDAATDSSVAASDATYIVAAAAATYAAASADATAVITRPIDLLIEMTAINQEPDHA